MVEGPIAGAMRIVLEDGGEMIAASLTVAYVYRPGTREASRPELFRPLDPSWAGARPAPRPRTPKSLPASRYRKSAGRDLAGDPPPPWSRTTFEPRAFSFAPGRFVWNWCGPQRKELALRARPTVEKRRKEKERQDRAKDKADRRLQRRAEKSTKEPRDPDVDPDIADIVPGPQPLPYDV